MTECPECNSQFEITASTVSLMANGYDAIGPGFCPYCGTEVDFFSEE
jgi:hypothetical protein